MPNAVYEMLAGTPPLQGDNLLNIADAIRSRAPEPLSAEASSPRDDSRGETK